MAIYAVVVIGVVVVAAFVARRVFLDDSTHRVGTDSALDDYRNHTASASSTTSSPGATTAATTQTTLAPSRLPSQGVYQYRTDGAEHVDVLGGSTHQYPAVTTLTVTSGGCGEILHWVILKERVDDWELCSYGGATGVLLGRQGLQTHTFFGKGEDNPSVCEMATLVVPSKPTEWWGDPETRHCTLRKLEPWDHTIQRLGPSYVTVEGKPVRVVHIRMVIEKPGHFYEHSTIDWWLDESGLPLQMMSTKESKNDSGVIGDVTYTEHFSAQIMSLLPQT